MSDKKKQKEKPWTNVNCRTDDGLYAKFKGACALKGVSLVEGNGLALGTWASKVIREAKK